MTPRLLGQTALVTGASRGLGWGLARALVAAGAKVWAVAEHRDELHHACASMSGPGAAQPLVADLRRRDDLAAVIRAAEASSPSLRVLVNNAGVLPLKALTDTEDAEWDDTLAVNLTAPFVLTRAAVRLMRGGGGSIVNVSSRAGIEPFACEAAYCASKYGIEGFTKAAAYELEPLGIAINTVTPGARIKPTGIEQAAFDRMPAEAQAQYRDPATFGPAIELLALLRGRPAGLRFDLARLTDDIALLGFETALARIATLAEFRPRDVVEQSTT